MIIAPSLHLPFPNLKALMAYIQRERQRWEGNPARVFNPQTGLVEKPPITREASKPATKGKVVNLSRRDYSQARGPIVRSDNHAVYHWRGMMEAARRSQSCPGWLRWETILIKPKNIVQFKTITLTFENVADKLSSGEALAPAASLDDPKAWERARNDAERLGYCEPDEQPDELPPSQRQIISTARQEFAACVRGGERNSHTNSNRATHLDLDNGLYVRTLSEDGKSDKLVVYHEDDPKDYEPVGFLANDNFGAWKFLFGWEERLAWLVKRHKLGEGVEDNVDPDPFGEAEYLARQKNRKRPAA